LSAGDRGAVRAMETRGTKPRELQGAESARIIKDGGVESNRRDEGTGGREKKKQVPRPANIAGIRDDKRGQGRN